MSDRTPEELRKALLVASFDAYEGWKAAAELEDEYEKLTTRYDDALKRINDLQAEIEALKIICRDAN